MPDELGMDDEVQRRLTLLREDVTRACAGLATVATSEASGMRFVDVAPIAPGALGFHWIEFRSESGSVEALQVEAGHHGGRWELDATVEDVEFIWDVARAVIAGRVVETFGPGRSRVDVTLLNGELVRETGADAPRGCLPIPGWIRRGRTVAYEPYGAP